MSEIGNAADHAREVVPSVSGLVFRPVRDVPAIGACRLVVDQPTLFPSRFHAAVCARLNTNKACEATRGALFVGFGLHRSRASTLTFTAGRSRAWIFRLIRLHGPQNVEVARISFIIYLFVRASSS